MIKIENQYNISIQIQNGNYSFFSFKSFLGFDDAFRFIKIIHILISYILNLIMIISLKKRKRKTFLRLTSFQLISSILIINFIHTLSYIFNWITNLDNSYEFENDGKKYKIGGLLIGNALHYSICKLQGFLIIFSSLSQDISINIFFYIVNREKIPNKRKIIIMCLGLGYIFPFLLGIIYASIGGIGINDRYCYIKKFAFDEKNETYYFYENFQILLIILYSFRGINLVFNIYLLFNIIRYIRRNQLPKIYILKSSSILLIQIITFSFGLIYRISRIISKENNITITNIYLCINTLDGILFPLSFSLSNGIYTFLCNKDFNESLNSLTDGQGDLLDNSQSTSSKSSNEKTLALVDLKNENNFELSYT